MLNNHGWGLRMMIVFIGILFLGLFIVGILIASISDNKGNKDQFVGNYETIENDVRKSAIKYQEKYYSDSIQDGFEIEISVLKQEFLLDIKDIETKNDCDGYVIYRVESGNITAIPYIKCDNYTTNGYNN